MGEKNGVWFVLLAVIVIAPVIYFVVKLHVNPHKNSKDMKIKFNITVSQRGDGDFSTISEAILSAPSHNSGRFFIKVFSGVYNEVVVVPQDKQNIVLVGDGMEVTKITANRGYPEFPTSESATFTVFGDGFMAQDITFENSKNTVGNDINPAVALLCSANYTIFYRTAFIGYHDTLYAKEGKQFYRECNIFGTVDFIFGFAAAVFQRCNLYARIPQYPKVTYTAQGRQSSDQVSAFTLQGCNVTVAPEVGPTILSTVRGFLGRPWFPYSTVMVMESFLDRIVDSSGWDEWPDTPVTNAVYLEFKNWGPGADTSRRVDWPGYKAIQYAGEAVAYTASRLIQGDDWIPKTGVPYNSGFLSVS